MILWKKKKYNVEKYCGKVLIKEGAHKVRKAIVERFHVSNDDVHLNEDKKSPLQCIK